MFLRSCIWVRDNEALVEGGLLASSLPRSHAGRCYDPFDLFLAFTLVATAAVYAACLMHPQQIGPDEHEDRSRPATKRAIAALQ